MNTTRAVLASWALDVRVIGLLVLSAGVYIRGWLRQTRGDRDRPRLACFLGGVTALFFALESPLDSFDALSLSAHMAQHLLLLMIAPPLILLGRPPALFLRGLPRTFVKHGLGPFLGWPALNRVLLWLAWPPAAWFAFAASTIVWHIPRFYELAIRSSFWHGAQHACFFWTGILFWWPVLETGRRPKDWPRWTMLPYLLLADILNTALSAFLVFSDRVLYPSYEIVRLNGLSGLQDQAAAGVIMWVPGSIVYIVPAIVIAVRLFSNTPLNSLPTARRKTTSLVQIGRPASVRRRSRLPRLRRALQLVMLIIAVFVMRDGFSGSPVAALNLAGVVPWIHWRAISVLALLLVGNLFCMACPLTLVRDIGRRFLPQKFRWPHWLRNKWLPALLFLLYLWAYEAYSLWDSPVLTSCIIAGYFVAALVIDGVFRGASFCKYVCPIGQFQFLGSMVSPTEIRVRSTAVCRTCRSYDCIRGNVHARGCELHLFQPLKNGNMDCTLCLDCVNACPHDNVALLPAAPGNILITDPRQSSVGRLSKRTDIIVLTAIFVFGAFVNAAGMVAPVMMWEHRLHALLGPGSMPAIVGGFVLAGTLVLPALAFSLCGAFNRLLHLAVPNGNLIRRFILALLPLGVAMWAAHAAYHLANSLFIAPDRIVPVQVILLDAGLLLTLYVSWRAALSYSDKTRTAARMVLPWAVLGCVLYFLGVWILFQPMQMRGVMQ